MFEKLTRPLVATGILLAASIAFLLCHFFDAGIFQYRLGLDLQGGTRLVYSFDFEQAYADGVLDEEQDIQQEVLLEQVSIIRSRVDPTGVLEPIIHTEGKDRIVIELPGNVGNDQVVVPLGAAVTLDADEIVLDLNSESLRDLPDVEGIVRLEGEEIEYARRDGHLLRGLSRGHGETDPAEHAATTSVILISGDPIRTRIENLGEMSFQIVAGQADQAGLEMVAEREKLRTWLEANPGEKINAFNRVPEDQGGAHSAIDWYPQRPGGEEAAEGFDPTSPDWANACLVVYEDEDWVFRGDALGKVYFTQDRMGKPAVGFEMKPERKGDFADFTEEYTNRQMAIVLNGEIVSAPVLEGRLSGQSIIRGRFEVEEVRDLITVLRTGSLRLKPTLQDESRVGPTLGAAYVKRGVYGGGIALLAVLGFMLFYYRRLGVFSAVSLLCSMIMLMGGLAFLQATLTLPGIAGIILTVGMAVDANILIFDRIREERDKGRNVKQAAKNGFHNAMSAILDANITTFLTALILYNVGTGPVRGFAVTLMIGILTSVFSALIITRLLVHLALEKGTKEFQMGSWMADAKFKFIEKARLCLPVSGLVILLGIVGFTLTPNETKLGIEFLGGRTAMIRTQEPTTSEAIDDLLADLETEIGRDIEVKEVLEFPGTGFRITYKEEGAEGEGDAAEDSGFGQSLEDALAGVLRKGPVEVQLTDGAASLSLWFEESHDPQDLVAPLAAAGLVDPQVSEVADGDNEYRATGTVGPEVTDVAVFSAAVQSAFTEARTDSRSVAFVLSNPIPSTSTIGKQVVGELRDKAILAILGSLLITVLYIRVRFAEYSYGLAAVTAVLHDVLVTLAVLTVVMNVSGLAVEMSLPMIAAFLTIIGYSLNDTIVVFDRVRENLPRFKGELADVLDTSINQTLSRTIMTSMTTFLAVGLIFAFNVGSGNVLEGFSLAMLCGILVGTYSSIFVASPVFLFLERKTQAAREAAEEHEKSVARSSSKTSSEAVV